MMERAIAIALVFAFACAPPSQSQSGRTSYNAGVDSMASSRFEEAIGLFSKARGNSAGDPSLRHRAAFALGEAYSRWASEEGVEAKVTVDRLLAAEAWFRDAILQDGDDEEARHNLALAIAKRRELIDQMTAGQRALEARLDAVLADQRAVRDALLGIDAARAMGAATAAELATTLEALATRERSISADVGVVGDVAADERGEIEGIAEPDRTDEQKGRLAQLAALVYYLDRARTSIGDARISARREGVERAVVRSEAAVSELVRAREQLLDPAHVIAGLAAEEKQLANDARVLAGLESGELSIDGDQGKSEPPPHLTPERLALRQRQLGERAAELDGRLGAYVASAAAAGADTANADVAAAEAREVLSKAAPFVTAALAAMSAAALLLEKADVAGAPAEMAEAITNLARALEYFAGLRQIIELAYADQTRAAMLLDPSDPSAAAMKSDERGRQLAEIATLGRERLERMVALLAREKAATLAEIEKGEGDEVAQAKEANEARFAAAETHRAVALAAVNTMAAALAGKKGDALAEARLAQRELEELRRLFFSLIEHLKDLHRRQGTTRDGVSGAAAAADAERAALLGPLSSVQLEHAALGGQIGEALAAQADAAAAAGAQPGAPEPENVAAAADEVRQATTLMSAAGQKIGDAIANLATMSVDLTPTLDDQKSALDHLAAAIELLSPPNQDDNKDQEEDQKQEENPDQGEDKDQKDQAQAPSQDDVSGSDVERRLRALRENEANRRRERERERAPSGGVDKDW